MKTLGIVRNPCSLCEQEADPGMFCWDDEVLCPWLKPTYREALGMSEEE